MWRFGRKPQVEFWDKPFDGPLGDIEAAERISNICRSAAASAELAVKLSGSGKMLAKHKAESDRFERAARRAMEIVMKMSDDLMRDAAVREIIDLCLLANNTRTAQILFRAIQTPSIRRMVIDAHPDLG